jgi:hypothetical protein
MLATLRQLVDKAGADATDQAVLRRLDAALVRADRWVKTYCRWAIEAGDFTEYHDGGQQEIVLRQMRVTRTSGPTVDDAGLDYGVWYDPDRLWPDSSLLVAGTDYRLEDGGANGIVRRLPGGWGSAWGSEWRGGYETTRIRYRAGYEEDEIPDDLAGAVLDVALQMYLSDLASQRVSGSGSGGTGGAIKSVRRGQSQVTYMTAAETSGAGSGSSTSTVGGGDPYGVNTTLDLYRDWRFG